MTAIGIDAGVHTGFAAWDCKHQKFITLETLTFWSCFRRVLKLRDMTNERLLLIIEDPGGNKPVFGRGQRGRKNLKIAQNVGMNKKEAGLLIKGFRLEGIAVQPIVPSQSKWSSKMFKQITGMDCRTNEHVRDAARLVFGLRAMPDAQYQRLINMEE